MKDRAGLWKVNTELQKKCLDLEQKSFQIFKLFSNEVKLIFEAVQSTKLRSCYVIYDSLVDEEIFINLLRTNNNSSIAVPLFNLVQLIN